MLVNYHYKGTNGGISQKKNHSFVVTHFNVLKIIWKYCKCQIIARFLQNWKHIELIFYQLKYDWFIVRTWNRVEKQSKIGEWIVCNRSQGIGHFFFRFWCLFRIFNVWSRKGKKTVKFHKKLNLCQDKKFLPLAGTERGRDKEFSRTNKFLMGELLTKKNS